MQAHSAADAEQKRERPSRQINVVLRTSEPAPSLQGAGEAAEPMPGMKAFATNQVYADIQRELDSMVGLDNVKSLVYEIFAMLQVGRLRSEAGLASGSHVYHMIFTGNPGTGKTTIARIVARLLHRMGVLAKGHLIEVERADLVGEYIGHTAQKTRDLVKKAIGGALFVDEAYSLARGGEKDFGKEAIDTLVKSMEDYRNQFVLILAGYPDEIEHFLLTNPGLPSRFPIKIDFPDYTVDQLIRIAELMARQRDYTLVPQALVKLRQHLARERHESYFVFSNARYVRNLIERAIRYQAVRLLEQYPSGSPGKGELMAIRPEDIRPGSG